MLQPEFSQPIQNLERPVISKTSSWPGIRSWVLHILLFLATLITSTAFGSALVESFARKRPLNLDALVDCYIRLAHFDRGIWTGLSFSIPLLTILLAHELGHYLECRKRNVEASLPYFLPSPSLFGTFGAFIRIRSPIYNREGLFDIGIGGPLAGFVTLVPFLLIGMALVAGWFQFFAARFDFLRNAARLADSRADPFPGLTSGPNSASSDGNGRLGRPLRHGSEPSADWATGRRPHTLRHWGRALASPH